MTDILIHPGESVTQALAAAAPGDTVTLEEGTYRERVRFARGGREGAPITLRRAPGAAVVIDGQGEKYALELGLYGADPLAYAVIDGLQVTGTHSHGVLSRPDAHHLVIRNVYAYQCGWNGVYLFPSGGDRPGLAGNYLLENVVASHNRGHGIKVGGSHIRILNCTSLANGTPDTGSADGSGLQVSDQNWDVTVEGGQFSNNLRAGIRFCAKGGRIANVVCHGNLFRGLSLSGARLPATDVTVDGAVLRGNLQGPFAVDASVTSVRLNNVTF